MEWMLIAVQIGMGGQVALVQPQTPLPFRSYRACAELALELNGRTEKRPGQREYWCRSTGDQEPPAQ